MRSFGTPRRGSRGPARHARSCPPGQGGPAPGQAKPPPRRARGREDGVPQLGWARAAHATSRPSRGCGSFSAGRARATEIRPATRGASRRKELRRPVRSGRRRRMMLDRPGPASGSSLARCWCWASMWTRCAAPFFSVFSVAIVIGDHSNQIFRGMRFASPVASQYRTGHTPTPSGIGICYLCYYRCCCPILLLMCS